MNTQSTFTQTGANSQQIQNQNNNFQNLKNVTTQNFQGANISNLTNIFNNNSGKKLSIIRKKRNDSRLIGIKRKEMLY